MQVEITPEPSDDERAAILEALAELEQRRAAPWLGEEEERERP